LSSSSTREINGFSTRVAVPGTDLDAAAFSVIDTDAVISRIKMFQEFTGENQIIKPVFIGLYDKWTGLQDI